MNILLNGIKEEDRELIKDSIESMISTIFKDNDCNVTEINIPKDFVNTVNGIHKEKHPDKLYFEEGIKYNIQGKTFNYKDDYRVIVNKDISYEEIFSTLYHELIHSQYYDKVKDCYYLKYDSNDTLGCTSFTFIDEYNAYKKTFLKFPKICEGYYERIFKAAFLCRYLGETKFKSDQMKVFEVLEINNYYIYMYRIRAELSIAFAVIDTYELVDNNEIFQHYLDKYYYGKRMYNIVEYLHSFVNSINNNIPTKYEFKDLRKCFNKVAWFYDIYHDE